MIALAITKGTSKKLSLVVFFPSYFQKKIQFDNVSLFLHIYVQYI